jgi:hypothetical protein
MYTIIKERFHTWRLRSHWWDTILFRAHVVGVTPQELLSIALYALWESPSHWTWGRTSRVICILKLAVHSRSGICHTLDWSEIVNKLITVITESTQTLAEFTCSSSPGQVGRKAAWKSALFWTSALNLKRYSLLHVMKWLYQQGSYRTEPKFNEVQESVKYVCIHNLFANHCCH